MIGKVIVIIVIIVVAINLIVFPLNSGSIAPGVIAIENMKLYKVDANEGFVAVIIEPRTEGVVETIQHYIQVLPESTRIQVYHGTKNKQHIIKHLKRYIQQEKILLYDMGVDNLTIQGYSALLTSKHFWNTVRGEHVLIFQTDTRTCCRSKIDLQQFLKYDYVGAPLPSYINYLIIILFLFKGRLLKHDRFYNGGLSVRRRSAMLRVIADHKWDEKITEDIWFCAFLPRDRLPSREIARKFSFEAEKLGETPWGLHKPRKEYDRLCKVCPEVKQIPFVKAHTDYRNLYLL